MSSARLSIPAIADAALDRIVLVGHSMGGLISKMMIPSRAAMSSGGCSASALRRAEGRIRAQGDVAAGVLLRAASLDRQGYLHRHPPPGQRPGRQFIGRLTDRLIRLPLSMRLLYKKLLAQNGAHFFTTEIREGGLPSSIDELRTDNRLLQTLARLPRNPVPVHSVIGQIDPNLPTDQGSDGVVPYSSSHLDWASSELVVKGDHSCQDEVETIRELRRILYLHLGKALPGSNPPGALFEESPGGRRDPSPNLPDAIRSLRGRPSRASGHF